MATTQTTTTSVNPCLLDEIGSAFTLEAVVRVMATLWTLPASLLTIAGYRYVFDRPPAPLVATYVDVSRAIVPLLAVFTLAIAAIWMVRTGRTLRRPTPAPAILLGLVVAESTVGWVHSMSLVDGASILSGAVALGRGLILVGAVGVVVIKGR